MTDVINTFVKALPETGQKVFLCRYWFKIDSNSPTSTSEYGSEGMVEHKIGDYFVYKNMLVGGAGYATE